eukprot:CAMPEP_0178985234 /NCGR_PEP_ID=MMETSP0795-20121207/2040_1 /TAXON_ID=88552 /ORGANISM="Amoebophrya sp., Strain Ameob2" /LENGTH=285 /DNA_ID=CAMNT_0020676171 /DNA_START=69 /DNA_END=923 /DNA_ORIENTATION=+
MHQRRPRSSGAAAVPAAHYMHAHHSPSRQGTRNQSDQPATPRHISTTNQPHIPIFSYDQLSSLSQQGLLAKIRLLEDLSGVKAQPKSRQAQSLINEIICMQQVVLDKSHVQGGPQQLSKTEFGTANNLALLPDNDTDLDEVLTHHRSSHVLDHQKHAAAQVLAVRPARNGGGRVHLQQPQQLVVPQEGRVNPMSVDHVGAILGGTGAEEQELHHEKHHFAKTQQSVDHLGAVLGSTTLLGGSAGPGPGGGAVDDFYSNAPVSGRKHLRAPKEDHFQVGDGVGNAR